MPGRALLDELKADPGQVGLATLLREIDKLAAVRALGLPPGLFSAASEKLVEAWRARAARFYPSDLRAAPRPVRLTLLAALCTLRASEITDALVEHGLPESEQPVWRVLHGRPRPLTYSAMRAAESSPTAPSTGVPLPGSVGRRGVAGVSHAADQPGGVVGVKRSGSRSRAGGGAEPKLMDVRLHTPRPDVVIVRVSGTVGGVTAPVLAERVGK